MKGLYATADRIGLPTGGGSVTHHERKALTAVRELSHVLTMAGTEKGPCPDVWLPDNILAERVRQGIYREVKLTHFYAGSFSESVRLLQEQGTVVTYTAAAHDVERSRLEHTKLGLPFDYPHLTEPALWERYLRGYLEADVLICPSSHSADVMQKYGRTGPIEIIPHGVDIPTESIAPLPRVFTVGYLGAVGPDKGIRYLLEAWGRLGWRDAQLVIGGRDSTSDWVRSLAARFGGGTILLLGWQDDVAHFYSGISLYVQPSVTEGFGMEVTEALAHGRPVLCSRGAGAVDLIGDAWAFPPADAEALAYSLAVVRKAFQTDAYIASSVQGSLPQGTDLVMNSLESWRENIRELSWNKVEERYANLWRSLL